MALSAHMKSRHLNSMLIIRFSNAIPVRQLTFKSCPELTFPTEAPSNESLQYLDLKFLISQGACLSYRKLSPKLLLSLKRPHPKHNKVAINNTHIHCALTPSCLHEMSNSLVNFVTRVMSSGFSSHLLLLVLMRRLPKRVTQLRLVLGIAEFSLLSSTESSKT